MRSAARRPARPSSSGSTPSTATGEALDPGQKLGYATLARRRRDRLRAASGGGQQSVEAADPLTLGQKLPLLRVAGIQRLDLVDLEAEEIEVAVARARQLAQLAELSLELARPRVRAGQLLAPRQVLGPAEGVEQVELGRGEGEPAVLVLAEEGHQPAAQGGEVPGGGRAAADEGASAPVGPHSPGQDQLLDVIADELGQMTQLGLVQQRGRQLEHALDVGVACPRANDPRARLAPEQEVERVCQDGLAGARSRP